MSDTPALPPEAANDNLLADPGEWDSVAERRA